MQIKYFDFHSGRYFMAEPTNLISVLLDLEERAKKGEFIKWEEYYNRLSIDVPLFEIGRSTIGRPEHKYIFEFELLQSEDCVVIYTHD